MEGSSGEVHLRPDDQVLLPAVQDLHPGGTGGNILWGHLQQVLIFEREQACCSVVAQQRQQGVPLHASEQLQRRVQKDEEVAPSVPQARGSPTLRWHHGHHRSKPLRFPLGQQDGTHRLSLG